MVQTIITNEHPVYEDGRQRIICDVYQVYDGIPPKQVPVEGCAGIYLEDAEKFIKAMIKAQLSGIP